VPVATSHLAAKLNTFIPLTNDELSCLAELQSSRVQIEKGSEILHQGEPNHFGYILQVGWGCSFKVLQNGERQIITFPVPGDCVGLRSVLLRTSDHAFSALTDIVVSRVEVPRMMQLFVDFPHVGSAILWATSRDEAITVEHLASIGRRSATERTAHFFLELGTRLQLAGLAKIEEYECPLTQYHLADALGLSAIHVNRVLRELREARLITFQDNVVTIHDRTRLKALSGYEDIEEAAVLVRSRHDATNNFRAFSPSDPGKRQ
jgi:CRP-like cAMP-binding protein